MGKWIVVLLLVAVGVVGAVAWRRHHQFARMRGNWDRGDGLVVQIDTRGNGRLRTVESRTKRESTGRGEREVLVETISTWDGVVFTKLEGGAYRLRVEGQGSYEVNETRADGRGSGVGYDREGVTSGPRECEVRVAPDGNSLQMTGSWEGTFTRGGGGWFR